MADIFLSYHVDDEDRAAVLVGDLESRGWSVWWDREVPTGHTYGTFAREPLDAASCIVVLWTESSVGERWVLSEALAGADRGILVPVRLDGVDLPSDFADLETADLTEWDGSADFAPLADLVVDVRRIVETGPSLDPRGTRPRPTGFERRSDGEVRAAVGTLLKAGVKPEMLDRVILDVYDRFPRVENEYYRHRLPRLRRDPARVAARLSALRRAVPDLFSPDKLNALSRLPRAGASPNETAGITLRLRSQTS